MSILHLMCGLPGSGKSTRAREIEAADDAIRLSPDEWMIALGHDAYDGAARAAVEGLQWTLAQRLLATGSDVILENGFWSRAERQAYRSRGEALGGTVALHFLDVPRDELVRRIERRNVAPDAASFRIDVADLDSWWPLFEPPGPDELESGRIAVRSHP